MNRFAPVRPVHGSALWAVVALLWLSSTALAMSGGADPGARAATEGAPSKARAPAHGARAPAERTPSKAHAPAPGAYG